MQSNGDPSPSTPSPPSERGEALLRELRALIIGHTNRREEARVLELFQEATAAELNELLTGLSVHELHELCEDMDERLFGPDNHAAFLRIFHTDRLSELDVASRARFIEALQSGTTGVAEEAAIGNVLLGTTGEALTALKNAIDQGDDYHDLQQLVFRDIDDGMLRTAVLAHFHRQTPPARDRIKVLSDIDDTFYASFKDQRYPKKTVYPGVRAFYAELQRGPHRDRDLGGELIFLSARPYDRAGMVEHTTRATLGSEGLTRLTVLSGDFAHLVGNASIAEKKFDNWLQLRQLYPEYQAVFIGDSGQGDALFGARAARIHPELRAVFIHDVTGLSETEKADFALKRVYVFGSYVGAATHALKLDLISPEGLRRVMSASSRELSVMEFASGEQRNARRAELERDLDRARAALSG